MQDEARKAIFERDLWRCQRCGMPATELAHRVAWTVSNRKMIMKRYNMTAGEAEDILNHAYNLVASCRDCNDYFNVGNKRHIADKIVQDIIVRMT